MRRRPVQEAQLNGADLSGACAAYADFGEADLEGSTLQGTDLEGANLRGVRWGSRPAVLEGELGGERVWYTLESQQAASGQPA